MSKLAEEAPEQVPGTLPNSELNPTTPNKAMEASEDVGSKPAETAPEQVPGTLSNPRLNIQQCKPGVSQPKQKRKEFAVDTKATPKAKAKASAKPTAKAKAKGKCKGSPKQQPQVDVAAKPKDGKPTKRTKAGVTGSVRVLRSHSSPRSSRLQRSRKMESRRSAPRLG